MYTIGRLARRAKVNADSIRFYERQGLLMPATKTASGYRLYTDVALRRITFIKHAQRCGFSLADIANLLQMHTRNGSGPGDGYRLALQKQTEIRKTMDSLQAMAGALACVLAARTGDPLDSSTDELEESPLLAALETRLSRHSSEPPGLKGTSVAPPLEERITA
jgi:MerR family Zn(II)-responsive transcriptional regulator of zntA